MKTNILVLLKKKWVKITIHSLGVKNVVHIYRFNWIHSTNERNQPSLNTENFLLLIELSPMAQDFRRSYMINDTNVQCIEKESSL